MKRYTATHPSRNAWNASTPRISILAIMAISDFQDLFFFETVFSLAQPTKSVKIFILRDRGPVPWKPWDRNCKDIRLRDNGWDLTLTSKQCHTMNKSYLEIVLYSIFLVPKWHPHSNWLWTLASRIWCIKHNLSSINFSVCQSLWAAIKSTNFLLGESCFLLLPFRLRCELEYQQQIADALTSYSKVLETATFSLLEAHQTLIDSWP